MWILRWVLVVIVILVILGFALQNQQQMVRVRIIHWESPEVPLYLVVYLAFAFGMVVWLFASIIRVLQLKNELRRARKESRDLREELNRLRSLALEEEEEEIPTVPVESQKAVTHQEEEKEDEQRL